MEMPNIWEYWFEPVSAYQPRPQDVQALEQCQTTCEDPFHHVSVTNLSEAYLWDIHYKEPWAIRAYYYGVDRFNQSNEGRNRANNYDADFFGWNRHEAARVVGKYVRVKAAISKIADDFWQTHLRPTHANGWILGVHMRGTDKTARAGGGMQLEPSSYYPYVTKFLATHPTGKVFVATDTPSWADHVKQWQHELGADRVVIRQVLRNPDNIFQDRSSAHKNYQKGEEVLVDMLLLSKAKWLIHSSSTVAEAAIWFNPDLHERSINLQYNKESLPVPRWMRV